ncbi:hypothetical protein K1719_043962 [Acacia pycnantha]|nr:hypothetical protein K1719_043962 [Acacia pycnantha]
MRYGLHLPRTSQVGNQVHQDDPINEAVRDAFGVQDDNFTPSSGISVGCIANSYPPNSSDGSLLMADIRSLPGMEGSPIFSDHASLTVIVTASSGLQRNSPQNTVKELYHEGKSLDGGKGSLPKLIS